jgi:FHS family L-fucose permease-like MFS transporter
MKNTDRTVKQLLRVVYAIYFFNGMAMCLEGTFNPEIKELFALDYMRLMYLMFAKNIPFLLLSVAVGMMAQKTGLKNTLSLAMIISAIGTAGIAAGIQTINYPVILAACFINGSAFTFQLVAGNPLLSGLGSSRQSSVRLNFANALGAIAQMVGMLLVYLILPATIIKAVDKIPYITSILYPVALLLLVLGIMPFLLRWNDRPVSAKHSETPVNQNGIPVWRDTKILLGLVTLFFVLGVEAGIFGLFRNFAEDPEIGNLDTSSSILCYTFYFIFFAAGRFLGAALQRRVSPAGYLLVSAMAALCAIIAALFTKGMMAVVCLIAVGFLASVFFPTIYSIAIEGMGNRTAKASGILTMGMIGGAILPVLQGKFADMAGLQYSFIMTALVYGLVIYYALKYYRKNESYQNNLLEK